MGVIDILDGATTGTKTVTLILDAALEERWLAISADLEKAAASDTDTGSLAMPETTRIVNEMEEIREQVEASQVTFHFAPMDWAARLALQAAHPPREGDAVDSARGYNVATFIPAIIRATCVKIVSHDGDESTVIPDATWAHLLGDAATDPPTRSTLTFGQVQRLFAKASATDEGVSRVPPSARFLLGSQDSGASLAQPSPGKGRPRSGSAGGSRRGSRSTSTGKKAPQTPEGSSGP